MYHISNVLRNSRYNYKQPRGLQHREIIPFQHGQPALRGMCTVLITHCIYEPPPPVQIFVNVNSLSKGMKKSSQKGIKVTSWHVPIISSISVRFLSSVPFIFGHFGHEFLFQPHPSTVLPKMHQVCPNVPLQVYDA